ncbi:hypothetical protein [Zunongwangia sp. H14]|uniref:hypothetical protein n=1 Tax=Zunongwangia sp. H14 TaxID=3240792 RepID=UPI0035681CEC
MFSTGQLVFAGLFIVAFVTIIAISYRRDIALHKKYYRGSIFVLVGFIAFILLLFLIKILLKH